MKYGWTISKDLDGKKRWESGQDHTQGSQSTLMAPQVELPQSWMNFSMEKTPVRSSTDLPYSAWRPLSWLSAFGSLEIHPIWATPMTLLFRLASRTPVQQAGQLPSLPSALLPLHVLPYPLVLPSVVFCRCSAWVYISVSTAPIL